MMLKAVLVMLAVLMPLLQASGQIVNINLNTGGNTGGSGTADKSQVADNLAALLKQTEGLFQDTSLLEPQLLDMSDAGQNMVITLLLEQNKQMQGQIRELRDKDVADLKNQVKNLALDLCHNKMTCCNQTLAGCPSGYELYCEKPDMCYKISTDVKNYTDAKSDCQADGGHLAMPKDQATNDFLGKQVIARKYYFAWIGLTDEVTEGTWMWEDGTKLGTGWNNWGHRDRSSRFAPQLWRAVAVCVELCHMW
ncbi:PREDICTED: asialoglycoprotein receptor 2-like [Branchiostoma belcheri]|uniref:Asialoglycoprotein receptor 2-like n=1 Tax=Branchiostoma belcheri TaxID=7741 RepID=A0A6P4YBD5_BRABE|nr:PREDICTED: asialoglycoprotein receptor 2-like [Branchiostoma belcheri]